jgi:hypothetical protein
MNSSETLKHFPTISDLTLIVGFQKRGIKFDLSQLISALQQLDPALILQLQQIAIRAHEEKRVQKGRVRQHSEGNSEAASVIICLFIVAQYISQSRFGFSRAHQCYYIIFNCFFIFLYFYV